MAGGSDSPGHPTLTAALGGDTKVTFWGEVTLRHSENEIFFSKVSFELEGSWALAKRRKNCHAQHENPLQQGVTMSL